MADKREWFNKYKVNKESILKVLKKYNPKAKRYANDPEETRKLLGDVQRKANKNQGVLKEIWEELTLLFEMVGAWIKGEYREIPTGSIIAIIAALIYFVSPIDLIPDFIAGFGFIDDAFVISFTVKKIQEDILAYKLWKEDGGDNQSTTQPQ